MGLSLADIHAPVPGYDSRLAKATDQLVSRLNCETILQRKNWTLLDSNEWFIPEQSQSSMPPTTTPVSPQTLEALLSDGWLRIEHQTLRRLPASGALVFGIATTITPTRRLTPDQRRRLWGAAMSAPPEVAAYKSWSSVNPTG
jgi:hypothetical protein